MLCQAQMLLKSSSLPHALGLADPSGWIRGILLCALASSPLIKPRLWFQAWLIEGRLCRIRFSVWRQIWGAEGTFQPAPVPSCQQQDEVWLAAGAELGDNDLIFWGVEGSAGITQCLLHKNLLGNSHSPESLQSWAPILQEISFSWTCPQLKVDKYLEDWIQMHRAGRRMKKGQRDPRFTAALLCWLRVYLCTRPA